MRYNIFWKNLNFICVFVFFFFSYHLYDKLSAIFIIEKTK